MHKFRRKLTKTGRNEETIKYSDYESKKVVGVLDSILRQNNLRLEIKKKNIFYYIKTSNYLL